MAPDILGEPLPAFPDRPPLPAPGEARWVVGAHAEAVFALAPRPLFGGRFFAERSFEGWWHPSLRLGLGVGGTGSFYAGQGAGASFLRAIARVEGCGFEWRPTSSIKLAPCLSVETGVVFADGVRQTTSFFAAGGLLPRLAIDVGPVVLDLQGGPIFPMLRTHFIFEAPKFSSWSVPAVGGTAALGVGGHFP
jgi:hypothetical protein